MRTIPHPEHGDWDLRGGFCVVSIRPGAVSEMWVDDWTLEGIGAFIERAEREADVAFVKFMVEPIHTKCGRVHEPDTECDPYNED